jgi:hypothetical protein
MHFEPLMSFAAEAIAYQSILENFGRHVSPPAKFRHLRTEEVAKNLVKDKRLDLMLPGAKIGRLAVADSDPPIPVPP